MSDKQKKAGIITKKEWLDHCAKNSLDSYSMAVNLAILLLWEEDAINRQIEHETLVNNISGISGAQAGMAIGFATEYKPEWVAKITSKKEL